MESGLQIFRGAVRVIKQTAIATAFRLSVPSYIVGEGCHAVL